ncbi:hypothetical protein GQ54DRAFT_261498 [Martensiomyces pterosporus]|nr:hypothetical protein GQ54DRAFT_261498 [Martensiomyces pterosporus]
MDLEPGTPVFLEEVVDRSTQLAGKTVRVTGTLHSYSPASDQAILVDGQHLVVVDTKLLGILQYCIGQTYQFIGVISTVQEPLAINDLFEDALYSPDVVLRARVTREVDGLDMVVYRKSVAALRRFLKDADARDQSGLAQ